MEHGDVGVYSWSPATRQLWWDERLAGMFAADRPGEAPFDTWLRRVHPDDKAKVLARIAPLSEKNTSDGAFRIVLGDGTVRHLRAVRTDTQRQLDGTVVSTRGVIVDFTGGHAVEGRLAAMLDEISDGFFLLDHDYRFMFVNRQAHVILGSTAAALLGRSIWDVFPNTVGTRFDEVYRRVMQGKVAERFEEFYPEPLNAWFEVRAEPAVEGIVIYFQDVTERRTRQEELEQSLVAERQARQEAEHAREDWPTRQPTTR